MPSAPIAVDVLVVCALFDEFQALLDVTEGIVGPGWENGTSKSGWLTASATFRGNQAEMVRIVATFASGMGRDIALATVLELLNEHPARCVAMSGICAGRRGKVSLGDVIFADRLYSYDTGKITVEDGVTKFEGDSLQFNPSRQWVQRMIAVANSAPASWVRSRPEPAQEQQEDWVLLRLIDGKNPLQAPDFKKACPDWPDVLGRLTRRKWIEKGLTLTDTGRARADELRLYHPDGPPPPMPFTVHVAPMATGAAVVEDTGIFPRLAQSMRKVLGIDMEASALGAAAHFRDIPVIVVKAVSDFGDPFKDDRYRNFATRASAEYLLRLLKMSMDLLPGTAVSSAPVESAAVAGVPLDLIEILAELYPEVGQARAIWERAGGKGSEVENVSRPQDLWQRLWLRSTRGASVRPGMLLQVVKTDAPFNEVIQRHLANWSKV